ncbi:hypothetical protein LCGC14_1027170 [marine sediment metagenome]|uniref:Uncharacterized protein n=1 Tax=marine sediment metagenome TaxID=412755 RepID=A0A0F9NHH5_9ZZZZ
MFMTVLLIGCSLTNSTSIVENAKITRELAEVVAEFSTATSECLTTIKEAFNAVGNAIIKTHNKQILLEKRIEQLEAK